MKRMNEDDLEQIAINWFREIGWHYANGYDIAHDGATPERSDDFSKVLLPKRLHAALARINPSLPAETYQQAQEQIETFSEIALEPKNRKFHSYILQGVPVKFQKDDKEEHDHVQLIDFEDINNNDFLVVNQLVVNGIDSRGRAKQHRPDVVVYVNGLPLVVIELKNMLNEKTTIFEAYQQLQTYKDAIHELFVYNLALVISDGLHARVGSLTAGYERFMPWRTVKDEKDKPKVAFELETLVKGFFDRALFLDYLRYCVLFEDKGDAIIKKIAGYHQFHAVRAAVRSSIVASSNSEEVLDFAITAKEKGQLGTHKAGVVWHTQGSGKSLSMVFFVGKLLQQAVMKNPTIIMVTDRNDLDGQLYQTFAGAEMLLRQRVKQVDSRDDLRDTLEYRNAGGIIFTTIQKFSVLADEERHPVLNDRANIVVISDEAHRSQYGLKARLDTATGQYKYGYARNLRDALPNATFIGFTGTPISTEDKDTQAVFGSYISIYDVQDAVDDGATVAIHYESRLAKLEINHAEIERLSQQVDEVMEDEESLAEREKAKSNWSQLAKVVGAAPRLQAVAEDLVQHFELRQSHVEGKAMIVCMSREICVRLYDAIVKLRPAWHDSDPEKGQIKVVMTGSAADAEYLQPHIYQRKAKKLLESRFKDSDDDLKLVIVRDMWLTGFDAPAIHTMYVDKPMRGHNLMQAIARVNRVFKDKPGGLVVDYIGIAQNLKKALKTYTDAEGKGEVTVDAEQAFNILVEKMTVLRGLMYGCDYSDFETNAPELFQEVIEHILAQNEGKKRFMDTMSAIHKALALCGTLEQAQEFQHEVAFFAQVRSLMVKVFTLDSAQDIRNRDSLLKQILDNAVVSEGVQDILALSKQDKPDISLLSDEFLEEVRALPQKNIAVELLAKLVKDEVKSRSQNNMVQEKKFADRLTETLQRYHNRSLETTQVLQLLVEMAQEYRNALQKNESLGLETDEIAFYTALAESESALEKLGDDTLKEIAIYITKQLRQSVTVDWQKRESVRARMRILVKRALKKWKYPPDKQPDAIQRVLDQAEHLSHIWTAQKRLVMV